MSELEWTNKYSVWKVNVGIISIVVAWKSERGQESGYYVSVSGTGKVWITAPFKDVEEAQQAGIRLAIRQAQRVLDALATEAQS